MKHGKNRMMRIFKNMNFKTVGTIFILLFFLLGCNILSFQERREKKRKEEKILEDWRKDSLGCLGLRNRETVAYMLYHTELKNKSKAFVLKKLGKPNFIEKDEDIETFIYYCNAAYDSNWNIIDSIGYCSFEIDFLSNKVIDVIVFCRGD